MAPSTTMGAVNPSCRNATRKVVAHVVDQPFADRSPTIKRYHVRFRPSLIDENEFRYVKGFLDVFPFFPFLDDILAVSFGSTKRFFSRRFLNVLKNHTVSNH